MKNYKNHTMRAFSLLLMICLLMAVMAVPAFATTDGGSAAVSSVKCAPGETVAMTLSLADFAEANAIGIKDVKAEGLTLNKEASVWLLEGGELVAGFDDNNCAAWCVDTATSVNGDIMTLAFDVPEDAAEDTVYTVNCTVLVEIDGVEQEVTAAGTCTVNTKFVIPSASMSLGNTLAMHFFVPVDACEDWNGTYAEIIKYNADGTTPKVQIPQNKWGTYGAEFFLVTYEGVVAAEMVDKFSVTIYDADGRAISEKKDDTIRDYAMRLLDMKPGRVIETVVVDMLNYGATAQDYFDWNEKDLANNRLTKEQQALATKDVKISDTRVQGKNNAGTSLSLESRIQMVFFTKKYSEGMKAKVEFTDSRNKKHEVTLKVEKYGTYGRITVNELAVADAWQPVKVTVYDAKGEVYDVTTDTMDSYIYRATKMYGDDLLYTAIMKFATSAYAYFHQ